MVAVSGDGCTLGRTDLVPTSAILTPSSGLFIDSQTPSPCSGQIISWRVCYYNPFFENGININSSQIVLQTWKLSSEGGTRIGSNTFIISISQPPDDFQCVNITVDPSDYINVSQGHYLGAYLTQDRVLPVIGSRSDVSSLLFIPADEIVPSTLQVGMTVILQISNSAIHVTATIGK